MTNSSGELIASDIELKRRRTYTLATIIIAGLAASVTFHFINGYFFNASYPYNTFLFKPNERFGDYFDIYKAFRAVHLSGSQTVVIVYFPLTTIMFFLFSRIPALSGFLFMVIAFIGTISLVIKRTVTNGIDKTLPKIAVFTIFAYLTYPFIFLLDRGNCEMLVFVLLCFFLYAYYVLKSRWSVLFLAIAISLKLFPAVFLVLLISDKRYKEAIYTGLLSLGFTLISCLILCGIYSNGIGEIIRDYARQLVWFNDIYAIGQMAGVGYSHTLWGVLSLSKILGPVSDLTRLSVLYLVIVALFFTIISCYVIFVETEPWKKVALMVLPMILLPFNSADYTMIYVLLPLVLFLNAKYSKFDMLYVIAFGLLLIPLDYYVLHFSAATNAITTSVIIYPAVLTTIIAAILIEGLWPRLSHRHYNGCVQII